MRRIKHFVGYFRDLSLLSLRNNYWFWVKSTEWLPHKHVLAEWVFVDWVQILWKILTWSQFRWNLVRWELWIREMTLEKLVGRLFLGYHRALLLEVSFLWTRQYSRTSLWGCWLRIFWTQFEGTKSSSLWFSIGQLLFLLTEFENCEFWIEWWDIKAIFAIALAAKLCTWLAF